MIYPIHFVVHFLVGVFCFWILPFPSKMTSVSGYGCPYCIITKTEGNQVSSYSFRYPVFAFVSGSVYRLSLVDYYQPGSAIWTIQ